ncbi:DUF3265 domain-containing protein [Vibrio parahaemolyticus]|nr:DUF3265 domain-containing protein [Vibrio parahaemolyticus]
MTNCSRGIHNALVLVFTVICSSFSIALFTP